MIWKAKTYEVARRKPEGDWGGEETQEVGGEGGQAPQAPKAADRQWDGPALKG